ncbi:metallophosphoesterase [Jiangella asiatica]|uniref:Phosphatase n=1 Tax=Jiangella asiatica TaxID=2530372 RepID=A0A4R5DWY1_9ACTN|nr:metallophosphoesterase [Jiangella asiatica]TDE15815.1 phosphatase [Jiangella asiatica]
MNSTAGTSARTWSRRGFLGVSAGAIAIPFGLGSPQAGAGEDGFRFGVVADCQYADFENTGTRHYRASIGKLAEAVETFNQSDLEFITHLGDFVDRFERSFAEILPVFEKARRLKVHVLGNHDFQMPTDQLLDVLDMPNQYYHYRRGGWRFVVLDTNDVSTYANPEGSEKHELAQEMYDELVRQGAVNAYTWNGAVGEDQLAWLEDVLTMARRRGEKVVLSAHHPVYPKDAHNAWNDHALLDVIDSYDNVIAYFNGHNHQGNYGFRNGVHYVTFRGMVELDSNAFSIVQVHADRFEIDGYGREPNRTLPFRAP